jgi:cysteine desulfurase/selenocysteine lyase
LYIYLILSLGCVNPVEDIIAIAHQYGAKVLIDVCEILPHIPIDVKQMDCDWLVPCGHKMCGPLGIGFLYGKLEILQQMPPFLEGVKMNANVFRDHLDYADIRYEFEAGTLAIADAITFGAATDYLTEIGMDKIYAMDKIYGEELEI